MSQVIRRSWLVLAIASVLAIFVFLVITKGLIGWLPASWLPTPSGGGLAHVPPNALDCEHPLILEVFAWGKNLKESTYAPVRLKYRFDKTRRYKSIDISDSFGRTNETPESGKYYYSFNCDELLGRESIQYYFEVKHEGVISTHGSSTSPHEVEVGPSLE